MFVFKIHKKRMLPAGHSDKQHSFFIHSRYLFQHTTVSQSPLTGQNKKALLFTSFSVTRFAGYYQRTTKKACRKRQTCKM